MSWSAELLLLPDTTGTTTETAAALVGTDAQITVAGHGAGLAKITAARYAPGEGIYATVEFGDDTPLGAIQ